MIHVTDLRKSFGTTHAVDRISFTVRKTILHREGNRLLTCVASEVGGNDQPIGNAEAAHWSLVATVHDRDVENHPICGWGAYLWGGWWLVFTHAAKFITITRS